MVPSAMQVQRLLLLSMRTLSIFLNSLSAVVDLPTVLHSIFSRVLSLSFYGQECSKDHYAAFILR